MNRWFAALLPVMALAGLPPTGIGSARAEETAGTILSIDALNGTFALEDGTEFHLAGDIAPEQLVIGMEVLVTYTTSDAGAFYATALEVLD
ncbi:MAG: hypothetical protein Tsb0019_37610 [Roseibium sp.]